ncbi:MAG: hypothetical protein LBG12_08310, partial [Synergistaceae bacterium]|nr:hypothetical protein [Synergistaceae bacterium]
MLFVGPDEERITFANARYLPSLPWNFTFADGTQMTGTEINGMKQILHGQAGCDDYMRGDSGTDKNDIYMWNLGDGNDTISDTQGSNVLEFGPNIKASDVKLSNDRYDLILSIGEESVRIKDWYYDPQKIFE